MNLLSTPSFRRLAFLALAGSALLLAGCASKGVAPVAQLATARASIAQAESAGALQLAPVEMLAAREKLGRAEAAVREERFADARRWAEQAEADAEVAERKSRAARSTSAVEELARGNAALEKELERKARP
jgi:hypothetical protein